MEEEKYYLMDSIETIKIRHSDDSIHERPLKVKGMKVQPNHVLETLRSREVWTVAELRKIERW